MIYSHARPEICRKTVEIEIENPPEIFQALRVWTAVSSAVCFVGVGARIELRRIWLPPPPRVRREKKGEQWGRRTTAVRKRTSEVSKVRGRLMVIFWVWRRRGCVCILEWEHGRRWLWWSWLCVVCGGWFQWKGEKRIRFIC